MDVDQAGKIVGLCCGLARVAGVDDADRCNAHGRAGAGHVAERRHSGDAVKAQFDGCVQHGLEKLADLVAEDVLPVVQPDLRPIIVGRVAVAAEKRLGQEVFHDRVVGAIAVEVGYPAEFLLDFRIAHVLCRRADGVTDQTADQRADGLLEKCG